jgi:hypothetical protein
MTEQRRRSTDRTLVFWFGSATWFVIAVTLASCGDRASTAKESSRASEAAAGGGWTKVATFNGTGDTPQNTQPFTVHGGKVRFRFTVKPNDVGPVPFLSQMFPEGAPVSPNELRRTSCASCDGQQVDELGSVRSGRYYLHVITSRPWTLTVEEIK